MTDGLFKSGGGDFYRPEPGIYRGNFLALELGPVMPARQFTEKDGTVKEQPPQQMLRWKFLLSDSQTGALTIDPNRNEQAIGEGLTSTSVGKGQGNEAKARTWLRALEASAGRMLGDVTDAEANTLIQQHAYSRTGVMLTFEKQGDQVRLQSVNPIFPIPGAVPAPAPAPAPAPEPPAAPAPVPVGATAEIPAADYPEN